MRKALLVIAIIVALAPPGAVLAVEGGAQAPASTPAIYLPSGANIVTEINVSDDNILGIAKDAASALLDDLDDIDVKAVCPMPLPPSITEIDIRKLVESTYGVKNVRVLIARYHTSPQQFIREFEIGVPKAGSFDRILMDTSNGEAAILVYAQPDNTGYMAAAYVPRESMIYAARIVGFVDVKQFMDVVGDIAKAFVYMRCGVQMETPPQPIEEPAPAPDTAE